MAKILLYLIEYIRGEKLYSYLKELENNLSLSKQELETLQKDKLKKLLNHTMANNSYYREKYKNYDVFGSFEALPVLTKNELRDNYKRILSDNIKTKLDLVETSGSTGIPLQFYRDRVVFGYTLASLYRAHRWWGIDVGCKEAMLWGVPVAFKKRFKARIRDLLLNRFRENDYDINPKTLMAFWNSIKTKKPDYLFGYSSMVYEFALFLKQNNICLQEIKLKAVICTAEKLNLHQREVIENVFCCKAISEYGSTETGIISYQCKSGSNHISDDCVYLEIVDENNIPVPSGQTGRVLVTVLNSYSSPIIRYDLGDLASKSDALCSCGLNLSILGEIEGRTSDIVLCPNGEVYHSIIFYYILKELTEKTGGIKQFKVHQRKINELDFYIVKNNDFSEATERFLRDQIKIKLGEAMKLNIVYLDQIKRKMSGKLKDFETDLNTAEFLSKIYSTTDVSDRAMKI